MDTDHRYEKKLLVQRKLKWQIVHHAARTTNRYYFALYPYSRDGSVRTAVTSRDIAWARPRTACRRNPRELVDHTIFAAVRRSECSINRFVFVVELVPTCALSTSSSKHCSPARQFAPRSATHAKNWISH
jgi:hypothetical protein